MKVFKFGGTSVGTKENFRTVLQIVNNEERKLVVLSAFSGATDLLLKITGSMQDGRYEKAFAELSNFKTKYVDYVSELFLSLEYKNKARNIVVTYVDLIRNVMGKSLSEANARMIVSFGEMISTKVFHLALSEQGISSVWINAMDFVRLNDREQPDLDFLKHELSVILDSCQKEKIIVTQGYICLNHKGEADNLKRGGSDYTATLIGAAITASEIQIWSDVDGLQNNDPRHVEHTFTIPEITYESVAKLAYYGAKVLHPLCMKPAMIHKIPVLLKNTGSPESTGTLISKRVNGEQKAVAARDQVVAVKLKNRNTNGSKDFTETLSNIFDQHRVKPIWQLTENDTVHVLVDREELSKQLLHTLDEIAKIEVERYQSIICITGLKKYTCQDYVDLLAGLNEFPIKLTNYRQGENHLLFVVDSEFKQEILRKLNFILFSFEISKAINSLAA